MIFYQGALLLTDIEKTQHYSKNELLLDGLIDFIPPNSFIIEPFYGKGDLVKNIHVDEFYDISFEKNNEHYRDTLVFPPNYKNKYIITNPPFLAKNKAKDKALFEIFKEYDDLYKIAMSTFVDANGGIIITPLNLFTDEKSKNIRNKFFQIFQIERLNIYLDSMFDNTDYNVCSFAFKKHQGFLKEQTIPTFIYSNKVLIKERTFDIKKENNYRFGGTFFSDIKKVKNIFSRVTEEKPSNATHISVRCIDKTD